MRTLLAMAWRNVSRNRRRSLLTAAAMSLSVAIVMSMMTLMDGLYGQMRDVVVTRTLGHVQVHHEDYPGRRQMFDAMSDADALLAEIAPLDHVRHVTPRLFGNALLGGTDKTEGAQLIGVSPSSEDAVRQVAAKVREGQWLDDDGVKQIVLGVDLAARLEVALGDSVVAVTQAADGSMGNELYDVVGIATTGSPGIDRAGAFMHLADLGQLLALDDKVHEIVVVADDDDEAIVASVNDAVAEVVGDRPALVQPWWEVDPATAQLFGMQEFSGLVLIFFFFGVSAVGVVNTLLMSVFERTREFGVMRAVGMRPRELVALVVLEAVVLGAISVAAGALLGLVGDAYLVTQGVDMSIGGEGYEMGNMTFDPIIYGEVTAASVWQPVVGVFCAVVLAAIWPALRAARLAPVDALREG